MIDSSVQAPPRESAADAKKLFEQLFPEEATRHASAALLADAITKAHAVAAASWAVTMEPHIIRLNVGQPELLVLFEGGSRIVVDTAELGRAERRDLGALDDDDAIEDAASIRGEGKDLAALIDKTRARHLSLVARAAAWAPSRTPFAKTHSPGVLRYLRQLLGRELPDPNYTTTARTIRRASTSLLDDLRDAMAAAELHFSDSLLATFFTALQVKGFVILSGISGTGKTKLAQRFAELMPSGSGASTPSTNDPRLMTVQPYMRDYNRIVVPRRIIELFEQGAESREVVVRFPDGEQTCKGGTSPHNNAYILQLRGAVRTWFEEHCALGTRFMLDTEIDADGALVAFRLSQPEQTYEANVRNWRFVPVRPDWRDSKSVLGYFNPLTRTFETSPLLDFIQLAAENFRSDNKTAWFLILDEMNLAHVEHYFADVLSVMESGRDQAGWTREPLRCDYPADAQGVVPPREIPLPPNLYIVGTVNIDETTHAFSPKVLDRAFAIELTEANFDGYMSAAKPAFESDRPAMLDAFSIQGQFAGVRKPVVRAFVQKHEDVRTTLGKLNERLQPFNLHFGFRVFDEIVAFLAAAEKNRLFQGQADALDAAVLMKVLPKFHGSRAKLEKPLLNVLAWCRTPTAPTLDEIEATVAQDDASAVREKLLALSYALPSTAKRCTRMLYELHTDGFAAFG